LLNVKVRIGKNRKNKWKFEQKPQNLNKNLNENINCQKFERKNGS
jgi:hypothetical protein